MTPATFADSSALVKLYADEADAEIVQRIPLLVVSELARVAVPAALWKKHRIGELSTADVAVLVADFEADYFGSGDELPAFVVVSITPEVLDDAARLVGRHGLGAYDAVQLASAAAADAVVNDIDFVAFDKTLCTAAVAEGIVLFPVDARRGSAEPG